MLWLRISVGRCRRSITFAMVKVLPEPVTPSIEKDLMINDEIDRLRLATTSALLSGRRDVVVVSSVWKNCLNSL